MPKRALDPFDLYEIDDLLSDEERMIRDSVARFVDEKALPLIPECFEQGRFPDELIPEIAELGLLGSSLEGYGCAGLNSVSYGLICQELERGDLGLRSFEAGAIVRSEEHTSELQARGHLVCRILC